MYSDIEGRFREGSIQGLAPLIVGALAIFLTLRTMMSTFRSGARLIGTLVRYGSLISLLVAAVGWVTGGQQQGGGLANILGGLASNNNNNNNPNGGMANGLFNMAKDYATGQQQQGAGNGVWDQAQGLFANVMEGQQQQQQKTGAKYNTRGNRQRAAAAAGSKRTPASNGGAPADADLSDIAQGWVKDALLKATGLDSLFGGDAAGKQKGQGKKEGRPAAR